MNTSTFQLFITIYCIALIILLISTIVLIYHLELYNQSTIYGTDLIFTGDYIISNVENYHTSKFGNYYSCHESDLYQNALNYATHYCISNMPHIAYISTDTTNNKCWTSNPNNEVYSLMIIAYLMMIVICVFIHFGCKPNSKYKTKTESSDELLNDSV